MFGVIRPCRHGLCATLFKDWMAHLCGLCLTLRQEHGQAARLVTNYDGLLVSVLVEAQAPDRAPRRSAGRCALRGMRGAEVVAAQAEGARLAAAVSLVLAAGKTRDHVADGDGPYARRLVAAGAGRLAERWDGAGERTGSAVGFDTAPLRGAVVRQAELERTPGLGLLALTEPTETAVAAAFAHTAVLAGRPRNTAALAEAGRFFGRLAHLLDAVEDLYEDVRTGAFNPLVATGTGPDEARRLCDGALEGLRLALSEAELADRVLVRALLVQEAARSVDRVFAAYPGPGPYGPQNPPPQGGRGGYGPVYVPPPPGGGHSGGQGGGWQGGGGYGGGPGKPGDFGPPRRPPFPVPCLADSVVCLTCGLYQPKWSRYRHASFSTRCLCTRNGCDCDCCCCCDACST